MLEIESSIVIPVFNKWDLTRNCLKSIALTTDPAKVEIIVVDNASSDVTPRACPFLGRQLFGDAFTYIRNDENLNFAGASNQGARAARGEFVIFLNNDTEVQQGWYEPLINDFSVYPDIAATGPLLVYPEIGLLGRYVQHLGVLVSPFLRLGHLYEGIPANSPLARKRRFFQVITAACMVIRKSLFFEIGEFDEKYINGFEDVDLCARLRGKGYRMTVNPQSLVVHYESQSPGRHAHEASNYERLKAGSLRFLKPDWHHHLENDGLHLDLDPWLAFRVGMSGKIIGDLVKAAPADSGELKEALINYPYWEKGWQRLVNGLDNPAEKLSLFKSFYKLFRTVENSFTAFYIGGKFGDQELSNNAFMFLQHSFWSPQKYLKNALAAKTWLANLAALEKKYDEWVDNFHVFEKDIYGTCARKFLSLSAGSHALLNPADDNMYNIWRYGWDLPMRAANAGDAGDIRFSILMPIFNPDPAFFRAALDSILAQTYSGWELCLADDASTDPRAAEIIREYMEMDSRIRVFFRRENGHIAAATNSALGLASETWSVLVDQDDLLAKDALEMIADAIRQNPGGMLFYSDEDKLDEDETRNKPYFKNGKWDWELFPVQNFVCHLAVYNTARMREIGGFADGFPGAQDHEFLTRYAQGLEASQLVHVPAVLYHWRAHEQSTASGIEAKGYAVESSCMVAKSFLDSSNEGGIVELVPNTNWRRVRYPLPEPPIMASIIYEIPSDSFDLAAHSASMFASSRWPHELIYVCKPEKEAQWKKAAASLEREPVIITCDETGPAALNYASNLAQGGILGFLDVNATPSGGEWLEEIVSSLCRGHVGAVGGAVHNCDGSLVHGGYLADSSMRLKPLFSGPKWEAYFGWRILARTVDALDGLCLFTKKNIFMESGALDRSMKNWAFQDYCLKLFKQGYRSVWWPFSRFSIHNRFKPGEPPAEFSMRWQSNIVPFNRNLEITGNGFSLALYSPETEDFSEKEYLRLYPDIAGKGIIPYEHYLNIGKREGRKGRLSRIDYCGLTPGRIERWKASSKNGIVVCTSLCGDYERLLPPAFLEDGWEYVCFSDQPRENWGIWDMREISYENADLVRRSRWAKMNLPTLFPDARWIFWIDANIVVADSLAPLLEEKREEEGLYMVRHPARNCVYTEAKACISARKDNPEIIIRQMATYEKEGMPRNSGMYENNFFLVNPKSEKVATVFAQWWKEYNAFSKRDQLALPFVFHKNSMKPAALLPENKNARNWPALHFLTHEETRWIKPPF